MKTENKCSMVHVADSDCLGLNYLMLGVVWSRRFNMEPEPELEVEMGILISGW